MVFHKRRQRVLRLATTKLRRLSSQVVFNWAKRSTLNLNLQGNSFQICPHFCMLQTVFVWGIILIKNTNNWKELKLSCYTVHCQNHSLYFIITRYMVLFYQIEFLFVCEIILKCQKMLGIPSKSNNLWPSIIICVQ